MLTSRLMGAALWLAAALSAFFVARMVPAGKRHDDYLYELLLAILASLICGSLATALDFGGWRDPEWRAALFALCGALAVIAAYRALQFRYIA